MVPTTFEEWNHCIVNDCKIKLTKEFIASRLKVYENQRSTETKKFMELYGKSHLNNIVHWLKRASKEVGQGNT